MCHTSVELPAACSSYPSAAVNQAGHAGAGYIIFCATGGWKKKLIQMNSGASVFFGEWRATDVKTSSFICKHWKP